MTLIRLLTICASLLFTAPLYANDYYTHGSFPATGSTGTSAGMRAELDLITAGFDKMPALIGNASRAVIVNGSGTALSLTTGTLTLPGNLTFSGANNVTFTTTGETSLTLPTSGTVLATGSMIDLTSTTLTGTKTQFNTACSDCDFLTITGSETPTNKTISFGTNTISGTLAQFNTACSDCDFATLTGAESLSSKTLPSPTFSGTASGSLTGLAVTNGVFTTSTVAADPATPLGIASKQYIDNLVGSVTAFARTLLDDADAATARTTLGVDVARTLMTKQDSTSGTSIDFTGIPTGVKRITVTFNGVSTSGTADIILQTGSGSVDTSGYVGQGVHLSAGGVSNASHTDGFALVVGTAAATLYHGVAQLVLLETSTNTWVWASSLSGGAFELGGGSKAFSGVLDRVRITTTGGANTFDAGKINVLYE